MEKQNFWAVALSSKEALKVNQQVILIEAANKYHMDNTILHTMEKRNAWKTLIWSERKSQSWKDFFNSIIHNSSGLYRCCRTEYP